MNPQLTKQLLEKYPKIFNQSTLPPTETSMCWLFEHGDGWYDLIDCLCFNLQFNTDKNNYPQVEATQVKEKFGTLNFYYVTYPNPKNKTNLDRMNGYIDGVVSFAEQLSANICEVCGKKGKLDTSQPWLATRCKEHEIC